MRASHVPCLVLVISLLPGCGPQCPASTAIRDDLPAMASAGAMTVTLRATRIAQPNESPAVLFVKWSPTEEAVQLTISDANGTVLAHPSAIKAQRQDGFTLIRLQDEHGSALPPGLYEITISGGAPVTARFEIVHCAVYY